MTTKRIITYCLILTGLIIALFGPGNRVASYISGWCLGMSVGLSIS